MNKQEAIEAMRNGKRVRHRYFSDEEYIYMDCGKIHSKDGVCHDMDKVNFWTYHHQPEYNSDWEIVDALNLGFWNGLLKKYPGEMPHFEAWIDEYKRKNKWADLFNEKGDREVFDMSGDTVYLNSPNVYELPAAMQFGIFLQYVAELGSGVFEVEIENASVLDKIPELISEWFFHEEDDAKHDHQQGKYIDDFNIDTQL